MPPHKGPPGGLSSGKKICLVILIVGMLALTLSGVAPYWLNLDNKYNIGLWYYCPKEQHCDHYNWLNERLSELKTSQNFSSVLSSGSSPSPELFYALHAIAGLAIVISFCCLLVVIRKLYAGKDTGIPLAVALLLAGLFGIAASVIVYRTVSDPPQLDWSFYLFAAGSGVTALFSCFLMCIPKDKRRVHPC